LVVFARCVKQDVPSADVLKIAYELRDRDDLSQRIAARNPLLEGKKDRFGWNLPPHATH
jgi:hypothetical protein